jgi:hypothetical protein
MKIIRVFPRKTNATPMDALAVWPCGENPYAAPDLFHEADEVHISVAFTWDLPKVKWLVRQWQRVAPVKVGGPAFGKPAGEFIGGRYLKPGYTITSRGCPNRCWFCWVWRLQMGEVQELPIVDGWKVQDDNLLACSEQHIRAVFAMLKRQNRRAEFTGGLDVARLRGWHVNLLAEMRPRPVIFVAYDTPGDYEPLVASGRQLLEAGFTRESHRLRCYVLIGYRGDTFSMAEARLNAAWRAGFLPFAMLYRGEGGCTDPEWRRFQRSWCRPAATCTKLRRSDT